MRILFRRIQLFNRARRLSRAGRLAAAVLLLAAGLVQPGAAPVVLAAPAPAARAAPADACTVVWNTLDDGSAHTLRAAVACATDGQTITFTGLIPNQIIVLTSGEIPITQSITLDSSAVPGTAVDAGNASRIFNISASGTVTLTALTLQNGTAASGSGGAVLDSAGSLVLSGTQVLSSTAAGQGGGLWANAATLINTQFISNTSGTDAGGAWIETGETVVTGGRFERNTCTGAACGGGGLNGDALTVTGTQFISNTSTGNGGGVWAAATLLLTNGRFQGNRCTEAGCLGGGLHANSTLTVTGTQFISNTSGLNGGGAWAADTVLMTQGLFQDNHCTASGCQGGGLYASTSLTLTGTDLISNTSAGNGGGAWAQGAVLLTAGSLQGNQCAPVITSAHCLGGGLYAASTLTVAGTDFISNTSAGNGGGAYTVGAVQLTDGRFQGNQCVPVMTTTVCLGGGLFDNTTLTVTGTQFISNTSAANGGGAYVHGAALLTNGRFQGNQCTHANCWGGGLYAGSTLTMTGTDFINNLSLGHAGGAWAQGAAAVTNSRFEGNHCTASFCTGGGLRGAATVSLTGTDFISNTSAGLGGGANVLGAVQLTNGRFQGNQCAPVITSTTCMGGGLYTNSTLSVTGTQFISNTSTGNGGGAWARGAAALTNGLFQDNRCTGAGCQGGGLAVAGATALVRGSSFNGNQSAGSGGALGITATTQITLANVTLAGNLAAVAGGGLYAGGTSSASLWNVTVADNQAASGSGVAADSGASLAITNTILSNNSGGGCAGPLTADAQNACAATGNCAGPITAGTHNLEFPGNTCATAGPAAGFTTADPRLAPLALNAPGTTLTQALLPGSPARDHGDPASCANALVNNVDQRGAPRPDSLGEACDLGAYEAGPPDWVVFLPLIMR